MTEYTPVTTTTATKVPTLPDAQTVLDVKHWTDRLFSFRVSRPQSLRFRSGEFVMIGLLKDDGKPLLRAYSIASPAWDDELEFYSIKVQDGPLTSRLQHIKSGDQIILTHTCREVAELEYGCQLVDQVKNDELMAELVGAENLQKLVYYPTTTREDSPTMGRITTLIKDGTLFGDLDVTDFGPDKDRAMVCGSIGLNTDIKEILEGYGLREGANSEPAEYVVEKAFVG
ncbi:MAG: ferredoxin--NADP reductase [Rhodobacteraceae bacterium]|nr:ferredoxin--NADP reductase [Paracoccaceae bacterium]